MKRLLAIPLMLLALLGNSQDKRFTLSVQTEFADKNTHNDSYDYGFNLGATIEYQMTIMYFNAEVFVFPDLNGVDYFHFQGTVLGVNWHINDQWRAYTGLLKPGLIIREGGPHAMVGFDLGVEHYFGQLFIGSEVMYDWKTDSKTWGVEGHNVFSLAFKIGIEL